MTISALKSELAALTCHPMTETNIDGVTLEAGCIVCATDERDDALSELADARQESADLEKELKSVEAEAEEWSRQVNEYESKETVDQELLDALKAESERFRETASNWAQAHANMQNELTALRKRKGVPAGVFANIPAIMRLLCSMTDNPEAKALLIKMQSAA